MPTVELLHQATALARQLSYEIVEDWLGGEGSGHCLLRGRKLILLDLAQTPEEHLEVVRSALRGERHLDRVEMSNELAEHLDVRSVA